MRKTALITGITGQDGGFLAQFLLDRGYEVHGMRLYAAAEDMAGLAGIENHPRFHLHYGDLTDNGSVMRLLERVRPDELYNLGAQSHVKISFDVPEATATINGMGTLRLLEAIRNLNLQGKTRFYQASSSEMFGNAPAPQNENTPFRPCSPYGAAKLFAYWQVRIYREAYGLHASNGILFNHESPQRGAEFVTRRISRAVAAIEAGLQESLALGNLDSRRDWGHAADYVEGMWLMMQQDNPDDYVLATGETRTVRDFVTAAFGVAGISLRWEGSGPDEKGIDRRTGRVRVTVDPEYFRPLELHTLAGDASKAYRNLGWRPQRNFMALVHDMVSADRALLHKGKGHDAFLAAE